VCDRWLADTLVAMRFPAAAMHCETTPLTVLPVRIDEDLVLAEGA
jgi:hypothetical protein